MAHDPTQVRVFSTGAVWIAAYGTAVPTALSTEISSTFDSLGFLDESGLRIMPQVSTKEIMAWQSRAPVRIVETQRVTRITVPSIELNDATIDAYFGNGTFADVNATDERFLPPNPGTVSEWALVCDAQDGDVDYRWVFDRCVVTDCKELVHKKDEAMKFELTFTSIGTTDGEPGWRMYRTKNAVTS